MDKVGVYKTGNLTFYMYPTKCVICTTFQCFKVEYEVYKDKAKLDRLKLAIINGKVKSVVDIADYTKGRLQWQNCSRPS